MSLIMKIALFCSFCATILITSCGGNVIPDTKPHILPPSDMNAHYQKTQKLLNDCLEDKLNTCIQAKNNVDQFCSALASSPVDFKVPDEYCTDLSEHLGFFVMGRKQHSEQCGVEPIKCDPLKLSQIALYDCATRQDKCNTDLRKANRFKKSIRCYMGGRCF